MNDYPQHSPASMRGFYPKERREDAAESTVSDVKGGEDAGELVRDRASSIKRAPLQDRHETR